MEEWKDTGKPPAGARRASGADWSPGTSEKCGKRENLSAATPPFGHDAVPLGVVLQGLNVMAIDVTKRPIGTAW